MSRTLAHVLVLSSLLAAMPAAAGDGDHVVIVLNARNPTTAINKAQVKSIYLGQTAFWHGVVPMRVVMRPASASVTQVFLDDVLNVSASRYKQTWSTKQLSGQGVAPPEVGTSQDVAARVRSNPGAIGFLLASEAWELETQGLRIVEIED